MACFGNGFHKVTITAKAHLEQEALVRDANDYSAKWKVPHRKSVNTTAFLGTYPRGLQNKARLL